MRGHPHFQVVSLGAAKTHVAGAQQHNPVRQLQLLQHGLGVADHLLQRVVALVGVRDLHHFHLVELVLTDQPACVAPGAARFRAEARRVSRQADGQVGLGHDLASHHAGQRDFGRGDQVQRFALAVLTALFRGEQVGRELGQLPGAFQGVGVDDVGRIALGVAVLARLQVQHELRQCAVQARDGPAHERKARAGQLGACFKVQAQRFAQLDMVAHGKVERARRQAMRRPAAHFLVGGFVGAHGHAGVRQVGHAQQQVVQLGLQRVQAGGGAVQLVLDGGHLGHQVVGAFALGLALADLLAGRVALRLQLFGAGLKRFALGFQRLESGHVQIGLGVLARLQTGDHAVQVFAEKKGIKHGRDCRARGCTSAAAGPRAGPQPRSPGGAPARRAAGTLPRGNVTRQTGLQRPCSKRRQLCF